MCLPVTNTLKWTVSTHTHTHTSVLYVHVLQHHRTSENMPFIFTALIYTDIYIYILYLLK